ncbi:hypothetical protein BSKO_11913 [Bryopsis sp. KO-2023]|nr:hypothetical protein BSKO_11913 [Bryopsis sp. KO-2023]
MAERDLHAAQEQRLDDDVSVPLLGQSADAGGKNRFSEKAWACLTFLPRASWNNGVICMNITIVIYSFIWVLTKEISKVNISVFQAVFCRSLFGLIATTIFCKLTKITPLYGNPKMMGWLFLRGVVGAIGMVFVYSAVFLLPVGDASALQLLTSIFVVFFAWVFGWEKGSVLAAIGAVICVCGGVLVSNPPFLHKGHKSWGSDRMMGIGVSLIGSLFAGLAYSLINRIGKSVNPMSMTMWFHTPSVFISAIPLLASFPIPPVIFLSLKQGLLLFGMAFLGFIGQFMLTRSYQLCNATTGAALQTVSVVYSYLLAYLILSEKITYFAAGGTAVIGVGLVLVAEGKRRVKAAEASRKDLENPED